jgi:3D (Asp-Asp-Asp) domain-containing protein
MEALKKNYKKIITLKQAKNIVIFLFISLFFNFFLFSAPVLADEAMKNSDNPPLNLIEDLQNIANSDKKIDFTNNLPIADFKVIKTSQRVITAYNSEAGQTDNSPCITANGFNVCKHSQENVIAANFLPFGAKVRVPELFGDKIFTVQDRMNPRHHNRIDVWMVEKSDAIQFGVKLAKIEVLE